MRHAIPVDVLGAQGEAMAGAIESCVHCGFCLPTCPTYATMGEEMDSPRGRIFLMKEVLEGQLELETALPYVDNCLGCQACETACPSGVAYGELITPFRAYAEERRHRGPPTAPGAPSSCGPCPTRGASGRRRGWAGWPVPGSVTRLLPRIPGRHAAAAARPAAPRPAAARGAPGGGPAPRARGAAGRLRAAGARAGHRLGDAARPGAQRRRDGRPAGAGLLRVAGAARGRGRPGPRSRTAQPRRLPRGRRRGHHERRRVRLGDARVRPALRGRGPSRRGPSAWPRAWWT